MLFDYEKYIKQSPYYSNIENTPEYKAFQKRQEERQKAATIGGAISSIFTAGLNFIPGVGPALSAGVGAVSGAAQNAAGSAGNAQASKELNKIQQDFKAQLPEGVQADTSVEAPKVDTGDGNMPNNFEKFLKLLQNPNKNKKQKTPQTAQPSTTQQVPQAGQPTITEGVEGKLTDTGADLMSSLSPDSIKNYLIEFPDLFFENKLDYPPGASQQYTLQPISDITPMASNMEFTGSLAPSGNMDWSSGGFGMTEGFAKGGVMDTDEAPVLVTGGAPGTDTVALVDAQSGKDTGLRLDNGEMVVVSADNVQALQEAVDSGDMFSVFSIVQDQLKQKPENGRMAKGAKGNMIEESRRKTNLPPELQPMGMMTSQELDAWFKSMGKRKEDAPKEEKGYLDYLINTAKKYFQQEPQKTQEQPAAPKQNMLETLKPMGFMSEEQLAAMSAQMAAEKAKRDAQPNNLEKYVYPWISHYLGIPMPQTGFSATANAAAVQPAQTAPQTSQPSVSTGTAQKSLGAKGKTSSTKAVTPADITAAQAAAQQVSPITGMPPNVAYPSGLDLVQPRGTFPFAQYPAQETEVAVTTTAEPAPAKEKFFDRLLKDKGQTLQDIAGYGYDIGRFISGMQAAGEELPAFSKPARFEDFMNRLEQQSYMGLTAPEMTSLQRGADRAMAYDVANIYNLAGGNTGAALGNLGRAAAGRYGQDLRIAAMDRAARQQNLQLYGSYLPMDVNLDRTIFSDAYSNALRNKQAGAQMAAAGLQNAMERGITNRFYGPGSQNELLKQEQIAYLQDMRGVAKAQAEFWKNPQNYPKYAAAMFTPGTPEAAAAAAAAGITTPAAGIGTATQTNK